MAQGSWGPKSSRQLVMHLAFLQPLWAGPSGGTCWGCSVTSVVHFVPVLAPLMRKSATPRRKCPVLLHDVLGCPFPFPLTLTHPFYIHTRSQGRAEVGNEEGGLLCTGPGLSTQPVLA